MRPLVHTCSPSSDGASQRALQRVVVVFETFQLQEVFGPLAALARGRQVGDLDGGWSAADWRGRQVFGCGLVILVQAGATGVGLHAEEKDERNEKTDLKRKIEGTHKCNAMLKMCLITLQLSNELFQQLHILPVFFCIYYSNDNPLVQSHLIMR